MENHLYDNADIESVLLYKSCDYNDVEVSIVIPTFKRIDLLKTTLISILNQKRPKQMNYEIVVVSNSSEFDYKALNLDFSGVNIKFYNNQSNLGMCGNMNRCAILASGRYIVYLQDDDLLLDSYLCEIEGLIRNGELETIDCLIPNRYCYYENHSSLNGKNTGENLFKKCLSNMICIGCKTKLFQDIRPEDCYKSSYNCFSGGPTCGILFKKDSLMASEGFDPSFKYMFDYAFFLVYAKSSRVVLYNKYLAIYRIAENASMNPSVQLSFFEEALLMGEKGIYPLYTGIKKAAEERYNLEMRSQKGRELILARHELDKCPNLYYYIFRVRKYIIQLRSGCYRRNVLPKQLEYLVK